MCEICNHTPCLNGCPNAPEPVPVFTCSWCEAEIYEDDEFYDINGDIICPECIEGCKKTAEREEPDYDVD